MLTKDQVLLLSHHLPRSRVKPPYQSNCVARIGTHTRPHESLSKGLEKVVFIQCSWTLGRSGVTLATHSWLLPDLPTQGTSIKVQTKLLFYGRGGLRMDYGVWRLSSSITTFQLLCPNADSLTSSPDQINKTSDLNLLIFKSSYIFLPSIKGLCACH